MKIALDLTLSFMPGEHHQAVSRSRRIIGERELQLELVEETEAREGGIGHEGRVAELVAAAEPGAGDVDGCNVRKTKKNHLCPICVSACVGVCVG